jgi:hypothetical protein
VTWAVSATNRLSPIENTVFHADFCDLDIGPLCSLGKLFMTGDRGFSRAAGRARWRGVGIGERPVLCQQTGRAARMKKIVLVPVTRRSCCLEITPGTHIYMKSVGRPEIPTSLTISLYYVG